MLVPSRLPPKNANRRDLVDASNREGRLDDEWIEFRPARWLVATVALLWLWLVRPKVGKRALVTFAWPYIPRRLNLIAGGIAAVLSSCSREAWQRLVLVLRQPA